jgi:hypothetical protein
MSDTRIQTCNMGIIVIIQFLCFTSIGDFSAPCNALDEKCIISLCPSYNLAIQMTA